MKALISDFVGRYGWPARAVQRPLCIGHRGACAHANENTLAAFRVAARLGAAMWEIDARLSRDGIVMVCHDDAVKAADGRRIVACSARCRGYRPLSARAGWRGADPAGCD